MKNLAPLKRKIWYWDNIVNAMHLASRLPLQAIRPDVIERFQTYSDLATTSALQNITPSPFNGVNGVLLSGCYSNSNGLSILKAKIKAKQTDLLVSECQYCNIGEPDTFDHYLSQSGYPEFSALSTNLILCCSRCNTAKGSGLMVHGERKTLNLYYDNLPTITYLSCTIKYKQNIPTAHYTLNLNAVNPAIKRVIQNHYDCLQLLNRFRQKSNTVITIVRDQIINHSGTYTLIEMRDKLLQEALRMKADLGPNHWQAVCREALANSNRFLSECGFA